jgi:hypothetical protein
MELPGFKDQQEAKGLPETKALLAQKAPPVCPEL